MKGTCNRVTRGLCVAVLIGAIATALAGCSADGAPVTPTDLTAKVPAASKAVSSSSMTTKGAGSGEKADPNAQNCISCTDGKTAPVVDGTVKTKNGVQVIDVTIKNGTYSPNRFTAQAGMPIDVVFTVVGKPATDCLASPTIKSLNKTLNITKGTKTLKLGAVPAGTYEFTCSMGMNVGKIVVQ